MDFPNTKLTAILFPSQGINYLNQFMEEINDWVSKTRKVVDNVMGFPLDIWIFPIGSRFEYSPPLSLGNHAPISFNVALT